MEFPTPESSTFRSVYRLFVMMACAIIIIFGMKYAAEIITPILLAFVLTNIFLPIETWLIRKGWRPWLALLVVLIVMLLVIGGLISVTVASITQFINAIPDYQASLQATIDSVYNWASNLSFDNLPIPIQFNLNLDSVLNVESFDVSSVLNLSANVLGALVDAFSNWLIVVLLVAFMLADFYNLDDRLKGAFKNSSQVADITGMTNSLRRYVSLTTYIGIITGVIDAVFLSLLGVDFAILWGMLGFLMNYIPNLGIWISVIPPAVLAFLEFGWQRGVIVIAGFMLINALIENVAKPQMMGSDLNISPLFIMLSLVLWSFVLGPMGTILAIPMTLIITRLVFESSEETHWLSVLMSAQPRPEKKPQVKLSVDSVKAFFQKIFRKKKQEEDVQEEDTPEQE